MESLLYIFSEMGWFVGCYILAVLWTGYLIVVAKIPFYVRFLAIPMWLMFTVGFFVTVDRFMGYPYPSLPEKAQVISYQVVGTTKNPGEMTIEAWMYYIEEDKSRLFVFPHTKEREEALQQAMRGTQNGVPIEVDISASAPDEQGVETKASEMLDYDIRHRGLPTKDGSTAPIENNSNEQDPNTFILETPEGGEVPIAPGTIIEIGPDGEIQINQPVHIEDSADMYEGYGDEFGGIDGR